MIVPSLQEEFREQWSVCCHCIYWTPRAQLKRVSGGNERRSGALGVCSQHSDEFLCAHDMTCDKWRDTPSPSIDTFSMTYWTAVQVFHTPYQAVHVPDDYRRAPEGAAPHLP
jgi:hypothetical protein